MPGGWLNPVTAVSSALLKAANLWTKGQSVEVSTLTDGATVTIDSTLSNNYRVTLGGNRTFAKPTGLQSGWTATVRILQDATGSRTITWNAAFKWPAGTAPTLTTTANAVDLVSMQYDDTDDTIACVWQGAFA